jgi:hypothetical protein
MKKSNNEGKRGSWKIGSDKKTKTPLTQAQVTTGYRSLSESLFELTNPKPKTVSMFDYAPLLFTFLIN